MAFKKAEKKRSLLRSALFGPAGAGKTMTSLRIALGMNRRMKELDPSFTGRIGVIDSERATSELYADRFDFDVLDLGNNLTINDYISAMEEAYSASINPLIVDSGTHAWQELLTEVDHLTSTKYKGNSFQAWSEGTPKQKKLVRAIQSYPGHLIWTMRSKTEWLIEKDERTGRNRPVRVGLSPDQGKGIEYEFSLLLEITPEHICTVLKDRTGKFQDKIIEKPGESFGIELIDWLNSGVTVSPAQQNEPASQKQPAPKAEPKNGSSIKSDLKRIADACAAYFMNADEIREACSRIANRDLKSAAELTPDEARQCVLILEDEREAPKYLPASVNG